MATSSSMSIAQFRSISLPSRSHPTTLKIEEELNKFKQWEISATRIARAETISNGLCGLVELYKCVNDLLNAPQTLQALIKHQNAKWVDELLEGPLKLLDICGITKDLISELMEHSRHLQSSLRRRKGDLDYESSISKYKSFLKKMRKDGKRMISSLKQMNQTIEGSILDVDQHVGAVIRVLREVNAMSICIFQSVLVFLTASKSKSSKWPFSRSVRKGDMNELESVVDGLCSLSKNCSSEGELIHRLDNLDDATETIETGLEAMYRSLIRSRTFLLNLVSC